ncbi:MAG: hypothetical protein U0521_11180 [Anaerolineae bacterium]
MDNEQHDQERPITVDSIVEGEKLIGLSFTESEHQAMLNLMRKRQSQYRSIDPSRSKMPCPPLSSSTRTRRGRAARARQPTQLPADQQR